MLYHLGFFLLLPYSGLILSHVSNSKLLSLISCSIYNTFHFFIFSFCSLYVCSSNISSIVMFPPFFSIILSHLFVSILKPCLRHSYIMSANMHLFLSFFNSCLFCITFLVDHTFSWSCESLISPISPSIPLSSIIISRQFSLVNTIIFLMLLMLLNI